jgi:hypothetical protein
LHYKEQDADQVAAFLDALEHIVSYPAMPLHSYGFDTICAGCAGNCTAALVEKWMQTCLFPHLEAG